MITLVVFLISVFIDINVAIDFFIIFFGVFLFIRTFESSLCFIVLVIGATTLATKSSLSLTHLVETGSIVSVTLVVVFENFVLECFVMVFLEPINNILLLPSPLHILQVVHVKFVLKVVNVCILLHIDGIEALQLSLKSFVFLLILGLHVLDTLQALVHSLKLLSTPLDLVEQLCLILTQLFHRVLHLIHLARLSINNAPDAFFNVLLLSISVKISADGVKELECLVAR